MESHLMSDFIDYPAAKTEQILTYLNIFTAKEIAAKFKHIGIKGEPEDACRCPVSVYLTNRTGRAHSITETEYIIYDKEHGVIRGELPKYVRKFVKKFDKGKYPELINE